MQSYGLGVNCMIVMYLLNFHKCLQQWCELTCIVLLFLKIAYAVFGFVRMNRNIHVKCDVNYKKRKKQK